MSHTQDSILRLPSTSTRTRQCPGALKPKSYSLVEGNQTIDSLHRTFQIVQTDPQSWKKEGGTLCPTYGKSASPQMQLGMESCFHRLYQAPFIDRWGWDGFSKGLFTNTCKGGPDAKRGALKIFDSCKGRGLNKITTDFPSKIEFTCFSMGLTCNFHGKKGGPEIFFQSEGGLRKIFAINIFCIRPPLILVFVNGP